VVGIGTNGNTVLGGPVPVKPTVYRQWWPSIRQSLAVLFLSCAAGTWWAWAVYRSAALPVGTAVFGTVGGLLSLGPDPEGRPARRRDVLGTLGLVVGAIGMTAFDETGAAAWALWAGLAGLWVMRLYEGFRPAFRPMADIASGVDVVPWFVTVSLGLHWSMAWRPAVGRGLGAAVALGVVTGLVYHHGRAWYQADLTGLPSIVRGGAYLLRPLWRSHGIVYGLLAVLSAGNIFLQREWLAAALWVLLMGTFMATLWIAHQWRTIGMEGSHS
jgi:hypothetical protein